MNPERVRTRGILFSHHEAGVLSGYQFAFNKISQKYPGSASANVMKRAGAKVEGVVYHLQDEHQIKLMDPFVGYPTRYDRRLVPIDTGAGIKDVWVYIANLSHIGEGLKPNRWYLNHLLAGRDFLSPDYFEALSRTWCLPDTEREPED